MLANQSVLEMTALQSALASQSVIRPKAGKWKRVLALDLLLTALIDAFSILVIFLLMSFSSSGDLLVMGKDQELPSAGQAEVLERNPVVKIEQEKMFLEDKEVTTSTITAALLTLRKEFAETNPGVDYPGIVTIQADRRVKYDSLNQIVVAAAQAGFSDVRFAVLMK
jgi:biopolymer transport protein ExbD